MNFINQFSLMIRLEELYLYSLLAGYHFQLLVDFFQGSSPIYLLFSASQEI
jgi:hypothetical protein